MFSPCKNNSSGLKVGARLGPDSRFDAGKNRKHSSRVCHHGSSYFHRELIKDRPLRERSGRYSYVPAGASIFGDQKKIFPCLVCKPTADEFLPSRSASRAIPVIRLGRAVIIYYSFLSPTRFQKMDTALHFAKSRRTEADAKHPESPFWCAQGSEIRV